MWGDENQATRRTVLQALGASGATAASPIAAARSRRTRETPTTRKTRLKLSELSIETDFHPTHSTAAISTIGLGDGLEVYLVKDVESLDEYVHTVSDLERVSDAVAGVHGVHWTSERTLRYSVDGKTIERSLSVDDSAEVVSAQSSSVAIVSDDPLPVRQTGEVHTQDVSIPFPIDCKSGGNVCCTDFPFVSDWCVRATASDSGHSPQCNNRSPPPMPHGHFAIFPEGRYRGGVNFWVGVSGNCVWVGEEHSSGWCRSICGPDGELPSLTDLKNGFEDVIRRAADAANIAVPAIVITALAYYLAASTLAPPTGVPLV